jgi:citrate lyase subunit beta/citryl-CoA lyase
MGVIIETVKGVLCAEEIAKASERVDSITLGAEDFSVDSGIELCEETYEGMLIPRMQLLFVARAYRKLPMGLLGSIAAFNDQGGFEKNAKLAYQHGFLGASCIHPNNVETLNRAFSPNEEELEYSGKVIEVFERSLAMGRASTTLEGKMIDIPHYEKAKQIRERAFRIEQFEQKKKNAREAAIGGGVN